MSLPQDTAILSHHFYSPSSEILHFSSIQKKQGEERADKRNAITEQKVPYIQSVTAAIHRGRKSLMTSFHVSHRYRLVRLSLPNPRHTTQRHTKVTARRPASRYMASCCTRKDKINCITIRDRQTFICSNPPPPFSKLL